MPLQLITKTECKPRKEREGTRLIYVNRKLNV